MLAAVERLFSVPVASVGLVNFFQGIGKMEKECEQNGSDLGLIYSNGTGIELLSGIEQCVHGAT
jgi:hypothetical protein